MSDNTAQYLFNSDALIVLRHKKRNIDTQISAIEAEQERIKEAIIKDYMEDGVLPSSDMLHVKKVPRGVIVTDESKLPEQFFRIERKLDKKALNEAVKGGEQIDGATLDNGGYTLMIRG